MEGKVYYDADGEWYGGYMKLSFLTEYVFLLTIEGTGQGRLFETEIHKKKLLDAAEECVGRCSIYGYCILDIQAYFLIGCHEKQDAQELAGRIMKKYEDRLHMREFDQLRPWGESLVECKKEKVWEELMALHFLPVQYDYTIWPEHYWWSSYQELLGRNWMRFQIPRVEKYIKDVKKSHNEWKKEHPEIFKRVHM